MSYTNQTTHYGIPLPTQNDLVNGLDWNTSSEAIDTAVYEASQAASTATDDVVAIKQDIVDLKAEDVSIKRAATELTGRVGTLEQNAALDEGAIQDAFDMITDKEVTQAQSDVEVAEGEWFRYNGVLYVATVAIHIDDTIIPNTNCRATNVEDEMPSGGSVIDDSTTGASTTWSSNKISGNEGDLTQLQTTDKSSLVAAINEVLSQIGGGGMKCVKYGTISSTTASDATVDITDLGFTEPNDYTILLNGYLSFSGGTSGSNPAIVSKTATSFTVGFVDGTTPTGIKVSYQILA